MSYRDTDRTSRFTACRPSEELLDLVELCAATPGMTAPVHAQLPAMADDVYPGWVEDVIDEIIDEAENSAR